MTTVPSPAASAYPTKSVLPCVLVMPAYNEEDCIAQVVRAWIAQFAQLFGANFQLVVVNDGSRDRTGEILNAVATAEPRLRVIHQSNSGHGGALLRGYREALDLGPAYVFHVYF